MFHMEGRLTLNKGSLPEARVLVACLLWSCECLNKKHLLDGLGGANPEMSLM